MLKSEKNPPIVLAIKYSENLFCCIIGEASIPVQRDSKKNTKIVRKNIKSVLNKFKVQNDTKNVEKSGLMTMSHNVCNKVDELIMQID